MAKVNFTHNLDKPVKDTVYNYGSVILASYEMEPSEMLKIIENLSNRVIDIKDLKGIKISGGFQQDCYHIASRSWYAGVFNEWPFFFINFSCDSNSPIHFKEIYGHLTTPGNPPYPSFYEATRSFLNLEYTPNQNIPIGINFIVPDYRARIKTLEIAENEISITTERKEIKNEDLIAQFYCKKGEKDVYSSSDLKLDSSGTVKITIPFKPDNVYSYLLEKNGGNAIDSKAYGGWYTDRNEGIVIRTTKESIETMLAQGENQNVEFKQDIDKERNEFLESVVAFANTNNGTILLGVDNEGKPIGYFEDFEKAERKITGLINGHCEPSIDVKIEQVVMEGKPVIVVKVKDGTDKPYLLAGKSPYKRVGKDDYVMKRTDLDKIYNKKSGRQDNYGLGVRL